MIAQVSGSFKQNSQFLNSSPQTRKRQFLITNSRKSDLSHLTMVSMKVLNSQSKSEYNSHFLGEWEDRQMSGFGICYYSSKVGGGFDVRYHGEFKKSFREGKGKMIWGSGDSLEVYDGTLLLSCHFFC